MRRLTLLLIAVAWLSVVAALYGCTDYTVRINEPDWHVSPVPQVPEGGFQ